MASYALVYKAHSLAAVLEMAQHTSCLYNSKALAIIALILCFQLNMSVHDKPA